MRSAAQIRRMLIAATGLLLLGMLFAGGGCGRRAVPPPPEALPRTMPSEEEARQAESDAPEAVPVLPGGERGVGREPALPAAPASPAVSGHQRYGYRVQIFATADEAQAAAQAEEYRRSFSAPVYVESEGLLFKVQVGDCLSRDEAEALRREAVGLGCEGAFIVDALVNTR
jgi:hypothetical protein